VMRTDRRLSRCFVTLLLLLCPMLLNSYNHPRYGFPLARQKHVFVHLVYSLYMIYDILSRSFVSHTVLYMLHSHVTLS